MPSDLAISVPAPAKLNLYLHVTGRRGDGYHELDSLVAFTRLGDTVTVGPADDLTLNATGPFAGDLPAGRDNIVLKAADGLRQLAAVDAGADITLHKLLPVASGIGGGSAATGKQRDASQVQNTPPEGWPLAGARCVVRLVRCTASRRAERLTGDSPKTIRMI